MTFSELVLVWWLVPVCNKVWNDSHLNSTQGGTLKSPRHPHVPDPHASCVAAREVLNRVGDKWSVYVIGLLGDGAKRFSEIKRAVEGISQRMLTLTLRGLERDGLVTRTVTPSVPPRVDYELTALGRTLLKPVRALAAWASANRVEIQAARDAFDTRAS
ncbi:MAG: helix-turn-helix transcriptional regulator [Archangium sp.]|nr:helix-turn-helix transcriptional regulator [Archangium sp.]